MSSSRANTSDHRVPGPALEGSSRCASPTPGPITGRGLEVKLRPRRADSGAGRAAGRGFGPLPPPTTEAPARGLGGGPCGRQGIRAAAAAD